MRRAGWGWGDVSCHRWIFHQCWKPDFSFFFPSHLLESKGTEVRARFILTFPLVLRAADRIRLCALSSGMGQWRSAADLQQPLGPVSTRWGSRLLCSSTNTQEPMCRLVSTKMHHRSCVYCLIPEECNLPQISEHFYGMTYSIGIYNIHKTRFRKHFRDTLRRTKGPIQRLDPHKK